MMPILMVFGAPGREAVLDRRKYLDGEGDLFRPVHLGLHDIDRAGARVLAPAFRADVVQRDQRGDCRVHDAPPALVAVAVEDRRVGHQVADIAHQHQRAAPDRRWSHPAP
jgi:hypothetical protein